MSFAWLFTAFLALFYPQKNTPHIRQVPQRRDFQHILSDIPPQTDEDTSKKPLNINDRKGDATQQPYVSPLTLKNPKNIVTTYELAPDGSGYYIHERVAGIDIRPPSYISREGFMYFQRRAELEKNWREMSIAKGDSTKKKGLIPSFDIGKASDIFGGGTVEIKPTGFVDLRFTLNHNRNDNPNLPLRQQRNTYFDFRPQIQMGLNAKIGDKLKFDLNYDTQRMFDFENMRKINYKGGEDQIIQEVQAGNVSMPIGNSLIQGRQNLMGIKLGTKFGPLRLTGLVSQEQGKRQTITIAGTGAVQTPFKRQVSKYDVKRHFFLNHYFRSKYEAALSSPIFPLINSDFRINRIEVWVTNQLNGSTSNLRAGVGFVDMGENAAANGGVVYNTAFAGTPTGAYPANDANQVYGKVSVDVDGRITTQAQQYFSTDLGLKNTVDFEVVNSLRKLNENEYKMQSQLGYIMLNTPLRDDQVLFVAYEYSSLRDGKVYRVGEFSLDVPANALNNNALMLKMIKPSVIRPKYEGKPFPTWDLMMKNIYSTDGFNIQAQGFFLDVKYESGTAAGKINFLPDSEPPLPANPIANKQLMQVTGIDRLTNNTAPNPDNYFDFVEGLTVFAEKGLVIFPKLEPFGSGLAARLQDPELIKKYAYSELYSETQADAENLFTQKNRYFIEGFYQSAGGQEVQLNAMNLAQGSVRVTAGGVQLQENKHYKVDYVSNKLTFLDPSVLMSGQEIQISFEGNTPYSQTKTMNVLRAEVEPMKDMKLGATVLNMRQRPFTPKTTLGDEPFNNTTWGIDANFNRPSALLTKWVDRLPLINTKAPSSITGTIETAQFIPGQPKQIANQIGERAIYLDDFEASKTVFYLQGTDKWRLASFPLDGAIAKPDSMLVTPALRKLSANFSRAKLAWYQIDYTSFFGGFNNAEIPNRDIADNYTRQIFINEVFPQATPGLGANVKPTFDLVYAPAQRGMYNYQTAAQKLNSDGTFKLPEENWAGVMRPIDFGNNTDFEALNIDYLEFWMMDPFLDESRNDGTGGDLYINLGRVSEDALPDLVMSQEHALPTNPQSTTAVELTDWARVSTVQPATQFFANDRIGQDVGYDGFDNEGEQVRFSTAYPYIAELGKAVSGDALAAAQADPSTDDFKHFREEDFEANKTGILERYTRMNGMERNSPSGAAAQSNTNPSYPKLGTANPDVEDINRNGVFNTVEEYWEYRINMKKGDLVPGKNYVVYALEQNVTVSQGGSGTTTKKVRWLQFRIPLQDPAAKARGGVQNFKAMDFFRMYLTGCQDTMILRMTDLQFVQTQWRRYTDSLQTAVIDPTVNTVFSQGNVSVQENSQKQPFNYVRPTTAPAVTQQGQIQSGIIQDERSVVLSVQNLQPGDARGIFRLMPNDLRNYERLRMWVHAEAQEGTGGQPSNFNNPGDLTAFIRLGLDNDVNYYEFEIPLSPSVLANGIDNVENVWKNSIDIKLDSLALVKMLRDKSGVPISTRFKYTDGKGQNYYVKGVPKISDVYTVMIGVRNPEGRKFNASAELWVNELRLVDFKNNASFAANAALNVQLADVATINATGSYRQAGFGPIDQKVSSRGQDNNMQYALRGQIAFGKFFPQKWGVSIPTSFNQSESWIRPNYDPQQADIKLADLSPEDRTEAFSRVQTYNRTRGIAFAGVRKAKSQTDPTKGEKEVSQVSPKGGGGKGSEGGSKFKPAPTMPYDLSNFDFSFAYNERLTQSPTVSRQFATQHTGGINYTYSFPQLTVEPFKKLFKDKKNLISDINFSPFPTTFTMNFAGNRQFQEMQQRPAVGFENEVKPTYAKNFGLTRTYNLSWALTKALSLNFNAINTGRVDEVQGYWKTATQAERDSVGSLQNNLFHFGRDTARLGNGRQRYPNLLNIGRTTNYTHNLTASYQLPFSKYQSLNFLSGSVNYGATFLWAQAPETATQIGGNVGNTRNIQAMGKVDLGKLYAKLKPIKELLKESERQALTVVGQKPAAGTPKPAATGKEGQKGDTWKSQNSDDTRFIRRTETRPEIAAEPGKTGKTDKPAAAKDTTKVHLPLALKVAATQFARILLSIQSIDISYTRTGGTTLPGYLARTDNFGGDFNYNGTSSIPPSWGFLAGSQQDIRQQGVAAGWITRDTFLSNFFSQNFTEQFTLRTSIEPVKSLRIDLTAQRNRSEDFQELFRYRPDQNTFNGSNQFLNGTFTMSYIFIGTAFERMPKVDSVNVQNSYASKSYDEFRKNRGIISQRLAAENRRINGEVLSGTIQDTAFSDISYVNGYTGNSANVMISSMLAAYGVYSPEKVTLSMFPKVPLPNWTATYNMLNALPFLKDKFTSITLRHNYTASYSVGNFSLNIPAIDPRNPTADYRDPNYLSNQTIKTNGRTSSGGDAFNFESVRNVSNVLMKEDFSPLIGVNAAMKNGANMSFDYKRGRDMGLSLGSMQITEVQRRDVSLQMGYTRQSQKKHLMKVFGRDLKLDDNFKYQLRMTYRDNMTLNRYLDPNIPAQVTQGTKQFMLSPSVDYVAGKRMTLRVFYEHTLTNPRVNNGSFKTVFWSGGFEVKLMLN